ncbi:MULTISPECIES: M3 family metallopeptidase [unclassified Luteococcus]|uniref:M3 family metallopeptidase n=1 Tax=unclassified Luteococcus TaxID=2639923 RepID=UPI00313AB186
MTNPLLAPSTRPFGLPDFSALRVEHYREAMEVGLAEQRAEVAAIRHNPEPPSFKNTVLALEASGRTLGRTQRVFWNKVAADSDEAVRALQAELAPRLAEHRDGIMLDRELFGRVSAVREQLAGEPAGRDPEEVQLTERTWRQMQLAGAALSEQDKTRLVALNQELSRLTTRFQDNLLAETNDCAVLFDDAAELDGLTAGQLAACASAAEARGKPGKYLVTQMLFTDHPYLAQLTCRESRERIHRASTSRGNRGNEQDNNDLVRRISALRAQRAGLLGFANHASLVASDETIGSTERIDQVVYPLAAPAMANLQREALLLAERSGAPLEPWDWSYWAERVRAEVHDVDTARLREWFSYDRVLVDGVFWAATQLYGITFRERAELETYHRDVRAFEVFDADGSPLGLFLHDVFTRDSKRRGAWMNNLVEQNLLFDELPVVCNNLNVPKPPPGEPVLLSLDEVTTMFHEFGHALHGLLSRVRFPSLSGTNVPRDFVEFPSQVNEMWLTWPEVVDHYARHHVTGEPIEPDLLRRLADSQRFNQGFATTEYLATALLDQEWHRLAPGQEAADVQAFEAQALERVGLANDLVPPRYRSTYLAHSFAGGYDAGYYSYIFSEVLDADTVQWFRQNGGLTRANGQHFRDEVLSRGFTRDPLASFRAFRGRDAEIQPLLERRGLD